MAVKPGGCVPFEVCRALVEEVIREALAGRFFNGTVEATLAVARGKVEQLRVDLAEAEDGTPSPHPCSSAGAGHRPCRDQRKGG
ncbi:MAG TPA: hypothetical protein VFV01_04220 [Spirillospora sp.]|nr:hypothetical protein [Spirillospora sp.]